jgi:hypothetical protein
MADEEAKQQSKLKTVFIVFIFILGLNFRDKDKIW